MATPTIVFNNSTGSDSTSSGAGPAIAVSGTNASFSGSVVTLDGSPDLSGVATDGTAVLFLDTSTGRKFFTINAVNDGADQVTVDDAPAGTSTGLTWGIGGKRADPFSASSVVLFSSDAKAGWVLEIEYTGTDYTHNTAISCTASGSSSGFITVRGTGAQRPKLDCINSAMQTQAWQYGAYWKYENLSFDHSSNQRLTQGYFMTASGIARVTWENCDFTETGSPSVVTPAAVRYQGNQTHQIHTLMGCTCDTYPNFFTRDDNGTISASLRVIGCTLTGSAIHHRRFSGSLIADNIITGCSDHGISIGGNSNGGITIQNNTIHGNGGDGILLETTSDISEIRIINNILTNNSGYAINSSNAIADPTLVVIDYNVYGKDSTANSFGTINTGQGLVSGEHDQIEDPNYVDEPNGDLTPQFSGLEGTAFPLSL